MIRIPYPIPMPERAELIGAGKESCAQPNGSNAKKEARDEVERIVGIITLKYGKESK